jgi:hypothetical protein
MRKIIIFSILVTFLIADNYLVMPNIQVNFINYSNLSKRQRTLFRDYRTYHLGDENFRSRKWARLYGQCYTINFNDDSSLGRYYLGLERFGTEFAAIYLNRKAIGYLPRQYRGRRKRPNFWSYYEWIEIPPRLVFEGRNSLEICSLPVPNPEFYGDLDDFQIRNIQLIKEYQ